MVKLLSSQVNCCGPSEFDSQFFRRTPLCREWRTSARASVPYQTSLTGPLTIEVRYVAPEGGVTDEAAFAKLVRERIRADVEIRFVRRDDLDRVAGGKFIQYVYEVPKAAEPAATSADHGGENTPIPPP